MSLQLRRCMSYELETRNDNASLVQGQQ